MAEKFRLSCNDCCHFQGNDQYVRYSNSGNNAGGNMSKFAGYFQSKSGNSGGNYNQRPGQAGDNGGGGESVLPNIFLNL